MKVLAIGNSFSQDATYYLHQIGAADHVNIRVVNLFIGGCSLEQHWSNIQNESTEYLLFENGDSTEKHISIQEALDLDEWDYVITQQASHDSGLLENYHPYLKNIFKYIKEKLPEAEFLLHQTWAYEIDSTHPAFVNYHQSQQEMYDKLSRCYADVANKLGVRLIPCGDIIQRLRVKEPFCYGHGGMSICRDGYHMNLIYGRYLLAAIWYKTLTGNSIIENTYVPYTNLAPNAICDLKVLKVIKDTVEENIQ